MPRKSQPLSYEEREKIRAARAALREQEELAAIDDRETERAIKAGEIPDPDGDESLMDDGDDDDGTDGDDGDYGDDGDDDGDDGDDEDADDEGGDDASRLPRGDDGTDDDDGGDGERSGSEEDAAGHRREGKGADGEAGVAATGLKPSSHKELMALSDPDLAALHKTAVGREPHAKASRETIIRNIKQAQAKKG